MQKYKVVSADKMVEIERLALADGCDELEFMEKAGSSIALFVESFLLKRQGSCLVTLLVGKGNNGGDAYVCGRKLLEKGFTVEAISPYPLEACSPLCIKQRKLFIKAGGQVDPIRDLQEGVLVDGLVGTGFKGKAEGVLAEIISLANNSKLPILSIDIASGVCGSTGKVETVAICADATIYLELPKLGFFLDKGWEHTGSLVQGTFGLPSKYIEMITPSAFLVVKEGLKSLLPKPSRIQNKYKAGYLLALAGSKNMMGAGALVSKAALRSGAGIVRWFYPEGCEEGTALSGADVIKDSSIPSLLEEMKRARALVIGPGMGRGEEPFQVIREVLTKCTISSVIDADALFFLSKNPSFSIPGKSILTPHTGELKRLLDSCFIEGDLLSSSQKYVEQKQVALLVKGAPNFLFQPGEIPCILPFGNPGMAKAGTGDVLSGVLGGLLAQEMTIQDAAILGCFLHGLAGDLVVEEKTLFCLTASDLPEYLPKAFKKTLMN